ncbi:Uncharacterised protein [Serratia quinivorans]|nr:Uncharacterised protein [Serratia quinivorans]CAI2081870.1 Uncharacterised protein [Serratia quinivorans]
MTEKHWSKTELLHQTVTHPNIIVKGTHSYYSDCWDHGFERSVVRYLHGDAVSRQWPPLGTIDQLLIGDYVCIAAEAVILMGAIILIESTGCPCIRLWKAFRRLINRKAIPVSGTVAG